MRAATLIARPDGGHSDVLITRSRHRSRVPGSHGPARAGEAHPQPRLRRARAHRDQPAAGRRAARAARGGDVARDRRRPRLRRATRAHPVRRRRARGAPGDRRRRRLERRRGRDRATAREKARRSRFGIPRRTPAARSKGLGDGRKAAGAAHRAHGLGAEPQTPLRDFLRTETGGAAVLLAAAVAALVWVNVDASSYDSRLDDDALDPLGDAGIALDLRDWVNSGLMTFFFFVVGLEARREFDLGELRERRRFALPLLAGVGGMAVAVAIYLAFNAGRPSAHGWGVAMSTDTAFALGLLALVGPRFPDRLRAFMLTVVVVDDIVALVVIATVYTEDARRRSRCSSRSRSSRRARRARGCGVRVGARLRRARRGGLGRAARSRASSRSSSGSRWGCCRTRTRRRARASSARPSASASSASSRPPELARSARRGAAGGDLAERAAAAALPSVDELRDRAAVRARERRHRDRRRLPRARVHARRSRSGSCSATSSASRSASSAASWLVTRLSRGRLRPPVGWAAVAGGGTIAGIGFTVSLLDRDARVRRARSSRRRSSASSARRSCASVAHLAALPRDRAAAAARCGSARCSAPPSRSSTSTSTSIRSATTSAGPIDAPVTLVEYGDFECPYCGQAEPVVRELLRDFGDVRYVWRHLPLNDVHPHAQLAAEAAEAAADAGRVLGDARPAARPPGRARPRRPRRLRGASSASTSSASPTTCATHAGAARVAEDVDSADLSGVSGTPTFFINGRRHYGAYDIATLSAAVRAAGARALARR